MTREPHKRSGTSYINQFIRSVRQDGSYEALGDGISIQDTDFRILYQNKTHKALFADHVGEYCYSAFNRRDRVCEKCPLTAVFNRKAETVSGQVTYRTGKETSYFSVTASAVKDRSGRIRGGIYALRDMTMHRDEDEKLREREDKYASIFNSAMEALYLIDAATTKIVDCNLKASELSGYSSRALKGMHLMEIYPDDEQDIISRIFEKAVQTGALSGICGISQFRSDKVHVPVELNFTSLTIGGKKHILCSARDISRQRETEERLRLEHERLINIFDAMQDGIYIVNQQYSLEYVNPALKREFGPVQGRKCYEYFNNRKSACQWCTIKKIFPGKRARCEWSSSRNGKTYDVIETPITKPDGSISRLAVLRDITEKKLVEEALRESEKLFRSIFISSPLGIVIVDSNGNITEANPAFHEMLGYTEDDQQTGFMCMTHSDDLKENLELFRALVEGKRDYYQMEKRCYRKDGSLMWGEIYATAIRDPNDSFKNALIIVQDKTERRVMEEKLRSAVVTDDLTGLFNRRGFFTFAEHQIKLAKRKKKRLALLYLDLDGLKAINDNFGHVHGDQALSDMAHILKRTFRESDIISRIGGDEFAVLMTEISGPGDEDIFTRHCYENFDAYNLKGKRPYRLVFSLGVAYYDPEHPSSLEELMKKADRLMYENKKKLGRERYRPVKDSRGSERRAHPRCRAAKACKATCDGALEVNIKDISSAGICLKSAQPIDDTAVHTIKLFLPVNGEIISKAHVVWSLKGNSRHHETGMQFLETGEGFRKYIGKFIIKNAET